ncbi:MAG: PilZ domain-containing protein [Sphingorhabdus sp.]
MTLHAQEAKIETSVDQRRGRRHKLFLEAEAKASDSLSIAVTVYDISDTGLLIETSTKLVAGELIEVNLPHAGFRLAEVVWVSGQIVGCKFTKELTAAAISAARLGASFATPTPNELLHNELVLAGANMQSDTILSGELSPATKLWIIIGLAVSLWAMLGAVAFWIMA